VCQNLAYYLRCIPNKIGALRPVVVYPENSSQSDFVRAVAATKGLPQRSQEDAMWHIRGILIVLMGISLVLVPGLRADSLQLKNGNFVQGKYLGGTERAVQFEVNGRIRLYGIDEILSISFAAASADGSIPSNDDDQKPRTNTGSKSDDRDNGVLRTALVNDVKARKPLSLRTSVTQNHSARSQQPGGQTGFPRSSGADLAPNSDPKTQGSRVSAHSTRVLPASSSILSD
jgi:hypothetical protein